MIPLKNTNFIQDLIKKHPKASYLGLFSLALLFTFMALPQSTQTKEIANTPSIDPTTVDTHIPAGFNLIPIDVENYESLDSVLGSYGVVDLYRSSQDDFKKSILVVRGIKILRAPLSPQHFAVLIPEQQAQRILKHGSRFFVVIRNPKNYGIEFVNKAKKKPLKILIDP